MNIQQMMKQAQQMQKKMGEMQQKMQEAEYEGTSGGGLITARINGKGDVLKLKIDPSLVDPEDAEVLEDLIVAALNNAKKDADKAQEDAMGDAMGGMSLPPGFKMPF